MLLMILMNDYDDCGGRRLWWRWRKGFKDHGRHGIRGGGW